MSSYILDLEPVAEMSPARQMYLLTTAKSDATSGIHTRQVSKAFQVFEHFLGRDGIRDAARPNVWAATSMRNPVLNAAVSIALTETAREAGKQPVEAFKAIADKVPEDAIPKLSALCGVYSNLAISVKEYLADDANRADLRKRFPEANFSDERIARVVAPAAA